MSESLISRDVLREICSPRLKLFRNNVGNFQLIDGRRLQTGLCLGSSDYVGWKSVIVTKEMIGKKVAVFTAIEFKSVPEGAYIRRNYNELRIYQGSDPKKVRYAQQINFIERVKEAGGVAGFVSSVEEGKAVVK